MKKKITHMLMQMIIYSFLCVNIFSTCETPKVYANIKNPLPWCPWNVTGVQRLVAVCVEFSDTIHITDSSTIQTRVNTMAEYFYNVSYGRITVDATFYGDHWERLNNTMEYYGQDANETQDVKGEEFIVDSVRAWDKFVNFSYYDCLLVIHAGEDQIFDTNKTELLWSRNYCYFGRTSKKYVIGEDETYGFWGMAYNSEFNEYGIMSHEFGHTLGLPDLYVDNNFLPFDNLSLMSRGCHNGDPAGTCPARLDGFSMSMLGWLNPTTVTLNSTEDVCEMKPLGYSSATLLKIPLSESEYYLIEVREKSGYDNYTVYSTSVIVYTIDEMKESKSGIATVLTGGIITQGRIYSDATGNVFVSFVFYNSSIHLATVGLSTQLFFVDIDFPDSVECFFIAEGEVQIFDTNNNPVQGIPLNISVGEKYHVHVVSDHRGKADFQFRFELCDLGNRRIKISSPYMLAGNIEKKTLVVFPWPTFIIAFLIIAWIITLVYTIKKYWETKKSTLDNLESARTSPHDIFHIFNLGARPRLWVSQHSYVLSYPL